jgi:hypothetical protein
MKNCPLSDGLPYPPNRGRLWRHPLRTLKSPRGSHLPAQPQQSLFHLTRYGFRNPTCDIALEPITIILLPVAIRRCLSTQSCTVSRVSESALCLFPSDVVFIAHSVVFIDTPQGWLPTFFWTPILVSKDNYSKKNIKSVNAFDGFNLA